MQDKIKELEDQIKSDEAMLNLKRAILKDTKKKNRKHVTFGETKFGRALFSLVVKATDPFVSLHETVQDKINNPAHAKMTKYMDKANKLLDRSRAIQEKDGKKSTAMAIKLAEFVMEVEDFAEQRGSCSHLDSINVQLTHYEETLGKLQEEIERLRPPKDEKKLEALKNLVSEQPNDQ